MKFCLLSSNQILKRFSFTKGLLFSLFFTLLHTAVSYGQSLSPDTALTGPMQMVKTNVILNDDVPCTNYTLEIVTTLNPVTQGTASVLPGGFIQFTPGIGCIGTSVDIEYRVSCVLLQMTETLHINVSATNLPANVIDENVSCYDMMPSDVVFGIHKKFESSHKRPNSSSGYTASQAYPDTANADGFQAPLVADLNNDGKPEILIMGQYGATSVTNITDRFVMVYNGQTGERILQFDLQSLGSDYGNASEMNMGTPYHRAPSNMAIADMDGDGLAEVVVCETGNNGKIYALKPTLDGDNNLTGFDKFWDGKIGDNPTNYKLPNTNYNGGLDGEFCYPMPYIADLNGDGIPEVIVYNKIFNGLTGDLLMSWQAESSTWKPSSVTATDGLSDVRYDNDLCNQTQAAAVRAVAMTGRRAADEYYADYNLAVPAIVDIDGDGQQEIITGNRIHKFQFNSTTDHTLNNYLTIEGPESVTVHTDPNNSNVTTTFYLSDGFTRVADIDGDGFLDIIVVSFANNDDLYYRTILVYVYDPRYPTVAKAANVFYAHTEHGSFSIPFVGDINGKYDGGWDGSAYTKKLPEICILSGAIYIDRNTSRGGRSGILFHPTSGEELRVGTASSSGTAAGWDNNQTTNANRRFNKARGGFGAVCGHIIGLTWDDNATEIDEKLKLGWAMEHSDNSNNTGITLFDFNNDNSYDICYRDNVSIRVISPKVSGKDYVELTELPGPGSSVLFKDDCVSATAFEYPTIADINLDGSADIIVAEAYGTTGVYAGYAAGWVSAYEYQGEMWAPCPPVWNQGMYDPTQIRENLQVNAKPQSYLTAYTKNGETITPFNGSWIQQPIVKKGNDYMPVVRHADARIINMEFERLTATKVAAKLDVFNQGTASIAASTPIAFYNGGITGTELELSTYITTQTMGVDIFPNERTEVNFTITTTVDMVNKVLWARIMDDGTDFPAEGHFDCDLSNNAKSCGPLKLTNEPSSEIICVGMLDTFTIKLQNNRPITFNNLQLLDSLGQEWQFVSATASAGTTVGAYNAADHSFTWSIPSLPQGNEVVLTLIAKSIGSGNIENMIRVTTVEGLHVERHYKSAVIDVHANPSPAAPVITPSPTDYCNAPVVALNIPNAGLSYEWYRNDTLLPDIISFSYTTPYRGSYYAVAFNGTCHSPMSNVVTLSEPSLYWNGSAEDDNWYNPNNWINKQGTPANTIPAGCSTIHIPGTSTAFPSLDSIASPRAGHNDPQCDSIIFHFGSEVAKPHYLTYNKAFVEYNFGYYDASHVLHSDGDALTSNAMERSRWYALAAPLKKIVTGDFSFGGFPYTWQEGFKSSRDHASGTLTGNWYIPETNVAMEVGDRQNYAICLFVPVYKATIVGVNDHKHLDNLRGIVKLPYLNDPAEAEHPMHTHSDGFSRIYYINPYEAGFPRLDDYYDSIARANDSYRFIFENNSNLPQDPFIVEVPVVDADNDSQIDEVMIGNPFISSLDFAEFFAANSSNMEAYYRLYNNGSFETKPLINGELIAPLQAFFVKPTGALNSEVDLVFTKGMSVTRTGAYQLRSDIADDLDDIEGLIKITVNNHAGSSYTSLIFERTNTNNVDWLLYTGTDPHSDNPDHAEMPQIFSTFTDYFNNIQNAAIQYIPANGTSRDIPINIRVRGNARGNYDLQFQSIGDLNPNALHLFDKLKNTKIPLVNSDHSYPFIVEVNDDPEQLENRFVLQVGKQVFNPSNPTALDTVEKEANIAAYTRGNMLYVTSSGMNIKSVAVSGIQGIRVTFDTEINFPSFSRYLNVTPGIYLVTVRLENGEVKTAKIVVSD
ncbi:MAG: DUF11 domain-containing protein [Dysgonamonadaceae bacterium]|nr:DUF11 domain-containing protein [Dysgonamonadaceae bacterium]